MRALSLCFMVSLSKKFAILLAAGESTRTRIQPRAGGIPKQHVLIGSFPLFYFALKVLVECGEFQKIIMAADRKNQKNVEKKIKEWKFKKVLVTAGGATRQNSFRAGMKALKKVRPSVKKEDIVLVHNAANPFVTEAEILETIAAVKKHGAAAVGHPVVDTLKEVKLAAGAPSVIRIARTLDRKNLWHMQTPQAFRAELYQRAEVLLEQVEYTDEMGWIEALGIAPAVLMTGRLNRKVTTLEDLEWAKVIMASRDVMVSLSNHPPRAGIGQDSHRFDRTHRGVHPARRGLTLGGVHLPAHPKLLADSDGDVMLHALCNAILQALGEDSFSKIADPLCQRGITDSAQYLKKILKTMRAVNLALTHVGFQLEGREPRIDPLLPKLKSSLSKLLNLPADLIGITATSGEDLSPFGRGEGLQCFAVATLGPPS